MQVLHHTPLVGPRSGGVGPIALGLAREQLALGHNAGIWCLDSPNVVAEVSVSNQLSGHIACFPISGPPMIGYSPAMEQAAVSTTGAGFDLVHQHGIWNANSRVTNRWRSRFRRPTVVSPQGTLEDYALKRSAWKKRLAAWVYEARNLRNATCLQATSEAEVVSFRRYGLSNPIAVIPNGVPRSWIHSEGSADSFRRKFSLPLNKRIMLFLSRVHPKKGLQLLFEAMESIKMHLEEWVLVIAGPEERGHRHELELLAQRKSISDYIRFVGPLYSDNKRDAFTAADMFVLPTHSDNFAIVVTEALGMGVPVLTTYGAPWREIRSRRCGWWVPVDVSSIREAVLEATRLPKTELEAMGGRGKTLVSERYTWDTIAEKTIGLYEWLLYGGQMPEFVVVL